MITQRFVGVKEVALYLGVKVSTVYSWIHTRKIPYSKPCRLPRFDLVEVDDWINAHKIKPEE